jgi:hypothetical protein
LARAATRKRDATVTDILYYNTGEDDLGKFLIFLPNGFLDDRFRIIVPDFRAAVVANAHWNRGPTREVALIGPLSKRDGLIAPGDAADLAELTSL